jgi:hypothetical protein
MPSGRAGPDAAGPDRWPQHPDRRADVHGGSDRVGSISLKPVTDHGLDPAPDALIALFTSTYGYLRPRPGGAYGGQQSSVARA